MGCLFSTNKKREREFRKREQERITRERLEYARIVQERIQQEITQQERIRQERIQQERIQQERIQQERIQQEYAIREEKRILQEIIRRTEEERKRNELQNYLNQIQIANKWVCRSVRENSPNTWSRDEDDENMWKVQLQSVDQFSKEFRNISYLFTNTTRGSSFTIVSIERVENPLLYALYLLKKEELMSRYGYKSVREQLMFHGTRKMNLRSIYENNLDWRKYGKALGNRFGKGTSLTPIAKYASHYCDKREYTKVMLVMSVLVGPQCEGEGHMDLPPIMPFCRDQLRYDSTKKPNGHVVVKYNDHEFYPKYVITFN